MLDLSIHCAGGVGDHLHHGSYADTDTMQSQQGRRVVGKSAWHGRAHGASIISKRAVQEQSRVAKRTRVMGEANFRLIELVDPIMSPSPHVLGVCTTGVLRTGTLD
jgi:hypothetical protein